MNKKENSAKIVEATEDFVKKNPLTSIIAASIVGYVIGRLIHKRSKWALKKFSKTLYQVLLAEL